MSITSVQIWDLDEGRPCPPSTCTSSSGLTPTLLVGCKQGLCQAEVCLNPKPPLTKVLEQLVPESIPTIQRTTSHCTMSLTIGSDPLAVTWGIHQWV